MKLLILPVLVLAITACGLDAIEGKSTAQADTERRLAVTLPAPAALVAAPVAVPVAVQPEPVVAVVVEPVEVAPPVEVCYPIFRVRTCE